MQASCILAVIIHSKITLETGLCSTNVLSGPALEQIKLDFDKAQNILLPNYEMRRFGVAKRQ